MRYSTITEVIEQAIIPALGDFAADYDVEAIARETHEYRTDVDALGREVLTRAGFEQSVSDAKFWAAVERHDRTA